MKACPWFSLCSCHVLHLNQCPAQLLPSFHEAARRSLLAEAAGRHGEVRLSLAGWSWSRAGGLVLRRPRTDAERVQSASMISMISLISMIYMVSFPLRGCSTKNSLRSLVDFRLASTLSGLGLEFIWGRLRVQFGWGGWFRDHLCCEELLVPVWAVLGAF